MAVFFYDLLRTTRRGRVVLLRIAYGLVLLIALYRLHRSRFAWAWVYKGYNLGWYDDVVDATTMSKFAEEFVVHFLYIQMAAVVILTPAYTAGAIAEERERGTLDCLLTTFLTPAQLVMGKLAARLAQLFGILLTGLPVLSLMPLWGGVSPVRILAGFGITSLTAVSLGALALYFSAVAKTVRGALIGTYAIAALACLLPLGWFSPVWALVLLSDSQLGLKAWVVLPVAVVCQIVVTVLLIRSAARALVPRARMEAPFATPVEPKTRESRPASPRRTDSDFAPRSVDDRALLWKELYVGGSDFVRTVMPVVQVFFVVVAGLGVILFVLAVLFSGKLGIKEPLRDIVRVVAVGSLVTATVGTVLQASASVGRERQRRTLDMLLTLPDGRDEVLRMKWFGSVLCGRWLLPGLGLVLVLGVIGGGIHPVGVPLLAIAAGIHVAFAASLGVYLSVVIPSTERAGFIAILVLFLAFTVPLAICPGGLGFLPPVAWMISLPLSADQVNSLHALGLHSPILPMAVLLGLIGYGCLASVLWLLAVRRFRREGDRAAPAV